MVQNKPRTKPRRSPKKATRDAPADCAIVGGGMIGATLALALARAGLSVVLVDRTAPKALAGAAYDGRASAIAYGSHLLLKGLGLWDALAPDAEPILEIRVSDGGSPLFLHYSHAELGERHAGAPFGWIVDNRAVRAALAEALDTTLGLTVRAPAAVTGWDADTAGATVSLSAGPNVRARLLVAADGTESALRARAGIGVTRWSYPQVGIVCTAAHERPHRGVAHERFLPAGPFAFLPMVDDPENAFSRHRSSVVWTERAARAPAMLALSDDDFAFEMQRRFGDWYGGIRLASPRWSYPLQLLHAETYIRPRLALIGDAAHTIHPIAGQGLNLGLRDVAALAEVLVDAHRLGLDVGSTTVLRRYERWRRADNVTLMAVTDILNRLFSNDIPPARWARDVGLAAVNRMPGLKRLFMAHAMGTVGKRPRLLRGEAL